MRLSERIPTRPASRNPRLPGLARWHSPTPQIRRSMAWLENSTSPSRAPRLKFHWPLTREDREDRRCHTPDVTARTLPARIRPPARSPASGRDRRQTGAGQTISPVSQAKTACGTVQKHYALCLLGRTTPIGDCLCWKSCLPSPFAAPENSNNPAVSGTIPN